MFLELPAWGIALCNVLGIPLIHLSVSWLFVRLPASLFRTESVAFRERRWERAGDFYEDIFRVRAWKHRLPDAAPWFRGFSKKNLRGRDAAFLRRFATETCRGEAAHWAQIPALLAALVWTPWPAGLLIVVYAVISNLPCIVVQRYNRIRLTRLRRVR